MVRARQKEERSMDCGPARFGDWFALCPAMRLPPTEAADARWKRKGRQ